MIRKAPNTAVPIMAIPIMAMVMLAGGCTTSPPDSPDDLCAVFDEKRRWYKHSRKSAKRWHTDIPIMMAIMYQESAFKARARPPRRKILWVIPGPRPASAYGYAQAIDSTWNAYKSATGRGGADRNDFGDAIDFIGWYNQKSQRQNKIAKTDARNLYLAYHEGQGGFAKRTYKNKDWLIKVAASVARRAARYRAQLARCRR